MRSSRNFGPGRTTLQLGASPMPSIPSSDSDPCRSWSQSVAAHSPRVVWVAGGGLIQIRSRQACVQQKEPPVARTYAVRDRADKLAIP